MPPMEPQTERDGGRFNFADYYKPVQRVNEACLECRYVAPAPALPLRTLHSHCLWLKFSRPTENVSGEKKPGAVVSVHSVEVAADYREVERRSLFHLRCSMLTIAKRMRLFK